MTIIRTALLATACALALAACGNDTADQASPAAAPPATDAGATPATGAPADAPADAQAGAIDATPAPGTPATDTAAQANHPAVVADCATTIDSTDAMQFDADAITVPSSCTEFTIHLTHSGQMPVAVMGHNVVIASQADMAGVLADGMGAGIDNDYVKPGDTRVVAHTELIGAGEQTSVTFPVSRLQAGGPYEFFCSFPGHAALMKGSIAVE
jgi:azurin